MHLMIDKGMMLNECIETNCEVNLLHRALVVCDSIMVEIKKSLYMNNWIDTMLN